MCIFGNITQILLNVMNHISTYDTSIPICVEISLNLSHTHTQLPLQQLLSLMREGKKREIEQLLHTHTQLPLQQLLSLMRKGRKGEIELRRNF